MTAPLTTTPSAAAPLDPAPLAAAPPARSWRWLRAVIPFVVLAALWTGTAIAHAIEEPNLDDIGTLSPTGTGDHGSSQLAESLRARGVTIDQVTDIKAARAAIAESPSTVFIPTPDFLPRHFLLDDVILAGARRVVLVQPGSRGLGNNTVPVTAGQSWWVTHTVAPNCTQPALAAAGRAAVAKRPYTPYLSRYPKTFDCYHGSVVGYRIANAEVIYVAATDPFRNDRIDEAGNAKLTQALLSTNSRVVWLDIHAAEAAPPPDRPGLTLPDYDRGEQDRTSTGFPTIDAFPSWLWAGLLLIALGALLLALARARRLGPPVPEPLPVVVPAAESVTGRGRLYDRANAWGPTLDVLRSAAISRMAKVLNPHGARGSDADLARNGNAADALVRQITARTHLPEEAVRDTLYDTEPKNNAELAYLTSRLDTLVAAVLPRPDAPPAGPSNPQTSTSDTLDPSQPPHPPQGANPW